MGSSTSSSAVVSSAWASTRRTTTSTSGEAVRAATTWGRGSGNVSIQDWWTSGRVALRVGPGIGASDITLMRVNDSLLVRTVDGFDRVMLEGYLGLIPDASTLRIVFNDGSEWTGMALTSRIAGWLVAAGAAQNGNAPTN